MSKRRFAVVLVAAIVGSVCALASPTHASLSGPPPSFVVPARDAEHILVMLSRVPVSEDDGNSCTLPNGEQVRLRETFPSSGLYELGSTTPVWTVDWYGEEGLVRISKCGRYMVRINRFGGDPYRAGGPLRWGINFYDAGVEIKSYDVRELVDYPSLMTFTTADYHFLWIDQSVYDTEIRDGFYNLKTSTREVYRFDVTTGEIVKERRFWKTVARASTAAVVVVGVVGVWLVCRRRGRRRKNLAEDRLCEKKLVELARPAKKFTYSVRSLLAAQAVTAVFCSICCIALHVGVLLLAVALALLFTWLLRRARQRTAGSATSISQKSRRALLWLLTAGSWLLLYVLSAGPVMGLAWYFDWAYDVRMVIAQVVYAPVYWLSVNTRIFGWQPVGLYFEPWLGY